MVKVLRQVSSVQQHNFWFKQYKSRASKSSPSLLDDDVDEDEVMAVKGRINQQLS